MKCPEHNMEMKKIAENVYALDGIDVFWICNGEGRFPRKHIIKTEDWAGSTTFYCADWKKVE